MKSDPLKELRIFIDLHANDVPAIRAELRDRAEEFAEHFGISPGAVRTASTELEDSEFVRRLVKMIKEAKAAARADKAADKSQAVQRALTKLAEQTRVDRYGFALLDLPALLAATPYVVASTVWFLCGAWEIRIPSRLLHCVAKLRKVPRTAWVDAKGLHIRWATGGLNLWDQCPENTDRVFHFPIAESEER